MEFFLGWMIGKNLGDATVIEESGKLANGFGKVFSDTWLFLCEHPWLWIPIGLCLLLIFIFEIKRLADTFVAK